MSDKFEEPFQVMDRAKETLTGLIQELEDLQLQSPKIEEVIKNMRLALADLRAL